MDSYIDIEVLHYPEIASAHIVNHVFYQLHLRLVASRAQVGVSFPDYYFDTTHCQRSTLGNRIRLHGSATDLFLLKIETMVIDIHDYLLISGINNIPTEIKEYAIFIRKHTKSLRDIERKRHFLMSKAKGCWNDTAEESLRLFMHKMNCPLPFVYLPSHSSKSLDQKGKNYFYLFIDREISKKKMGKLTRYGLSDPHNKISMPIF